MHLLLPVAFCSKKGVSSNAKLVYSYIYTNVDYKTKSLKFVVSEVSEATGICSKTVSTTLYDLAEAGCLTIVESSKLDRKVFLDPQEALKYKAENPVIEKKVSTEVKAEKAKFIITYKELFREKYNEEPVFTAPTFACINRLLNVMDSDRIEPTLRNFFQSPSQSKHSLYVLEKYLGTYMKKEEYKPQFELSYRDFSGRSY